jgi:mannose-6-phosphate isomerase-like protein (cupin superfamily)
MTGYHTNLEHKVVKNTYFREVLFTGPHCQLVLMSLLPGEDIGLETHNNVDQFFRVEEGVGKPILDGTEYALEAGSGLVIPARTKHNLLNTSSTEPLKLYTIYSPPQHPDKTVHKTRAEAEEYEKQLHH